jgi:signal transduction histidine kinase
VALAMQYAFLARSARPSRAALDALSLLVVGTFGPVAIMVARAEHYAFYVVGFSMVIWGSAVILRLPWRIEAASCGLLLLEFGASHLVWRPATPVVNVFGAVAYLASASFLVTIHAAHRRALENRAHLLSVRLEQRNHDLSATNDALRVSQARLVETEKLSALGRLLAGLSHEINNPVNVIQNTVDSVRNDARALTAVVEEACELSKRQPLGAAEVTALVERHRFAEVKSELTEALDDMELSSNRIQAIHRDLRLFVRGDASTREPTDVVPGLMATVGMVRRGAPADLVWRAEVGALPHVFIHPGQVNQILLNLLQNAVDAMGPAGEITVTARTGPERVSITIADTGPGVPAALASRVFEPFFTTKPVGKGTGLGLAISRELAERNGGTLELLLGRTLGACFVLTLPRAEAPAAAGS